MTAQLNAAPPPGNPNCCNACCAAPSAGVLVVAPQSMPTMLASGTWKSPPNKRANIVPTAITASDHRLSEMPSWRSEPKKLGPT